MSEQIYPGPSQMVKIDGSRVRSLREAKGLTQLYIATVVGVTTDTISRWENRRYPTIKEENALKLAASLEVSLEDILEVEKKEAEDMAIPNEEVSSIAAPSGPQRLRRNLLWILPLVLILLLPFIWYTANQPEPVAIFATRFLPPHIPAGQTIPVIIHVETKQEGPFSLILRETLPAGYEPLVSAPPFTGIDKKNGSLKWLARTTGQVTTFVYLAGKVAGKPGPDSGATLRFSGSVTLGDKKSAETTIAGSQVLPLADYHWADANRDNRIEDSEILAVYDTFSALDNVEYDWQKIDAIWSGSDYYWDAIQQKYVIRQ
jgi:transcriptional regulator with XRE-family HTH domain